MKETSAWEEPTYLPRTFSSHPKVENAAPLCECKKLYKQICRGLRTQVSLNPSFMERELMGVGERSDIEQSAFGPEWQNEKFFANGHSKN